MKGKWLPISISVFAVVISMLSYFEARRSTYYAYLRKVEELSVVPLEFSGSYDDKGWRYRISVSFSNMGDTEVILTNFDVLIWCPVGHGQRIGQTGLWQKQTIVMRPHTIETVHHEGSRNWNAGDVPVNLGQSQFEFSYFVQSGKGVVRRRSIPIAAHISGDHQAFALSEPQLPFTERFDPKLKAPSPPENIFVTP